MVSGPSTCFPAKKIYSPSRLIQFGSKKLVRGDEKRKKEHQIDRTKSACSFAIQEFSHVYGLAERAEL